MGPRRTTIQGSPDAVGAHQEDHLNGSLLVSNHAHVGKSDGPVGYVNFRNGAKGDVVIIG